MWKNLKEDSFRINDNLAIILQTACLSFRHIYFDDTEHNGVKLVQSTLQVYIFRTIQYRTLP